MYHSLALSLEEHNFNIHDTEGFDPCESDRNSCPNNTPLFAFQPITTGRKGRKWSGQLLPPQESSFLKEVGLSGRRRKMVGTKSFALTMKLVEPCIIH